MNLCCCIPAFEPANEYGGPIPTVAVLGRGNGCATEIWAAQYGVEGKRVPVGVQIVNGFRVRYYRIVAAARWVPITPGAFRAARQSHFDVAHLFGLRDGLTIPAAWGFRRAGIPYIVEPMGMLVPRVRSITLKRVFDAAIGTRHLRNAAGIVATSRLEERDVRSVLPDARVWVRPNPIEVSDSVEPDGTLRNRLRVPAGDFLVGYVGRVSTKKGLDVLADALARTPEAHAVIVGPDTGDGGERQLAEAVEKHRVGGRVHRLPPVWGEERDRLVAALDAFVLPSRTENFGNAAAEAAALGVPVVVSKECGVAEYIEKYDAGVVTDVDAEQLAGALARLRDDQAERKWLGENGRRLREELSPAKVVAQQDRIYREVIG